MNSKYKKLLIILSGLLLICFILITVAWWQGEESGIVTITYLDVGQGDSILIQTPSDNTILIDGGPDSSVLSKIGRQLPFYDHTIDFVILTHAHSDHVAGLVDVLKRYEVQSVLFSAVEHSSPDYLEWKTLLSEQGIQSVFPIVGQEFQFGEVRLEVLYPFEDLSGNPPKDLNETSIVTRLEYQDTSFLFTGDAPVEVEEQLLHAYQDSTLDSDVLKVGHHGSKYSSSLEFLRAVDADAAIIQVGEGNSFDHPHRLILKRFQGLGIPVLRNDLSGTIEVKTDGKKVWVSHLDKNSEK